MGVGVAAGVGVGVGVSGGTGVGVGVSGGMCVKSIVHSIGMAVG